MLNAKLGVPSHNEGRSVIVTATGATGHALYGPYDRLDPGTYCVDFFVAPAAVAASKHDPLCAVLDVARDVGNEILARKEVRLSQLRGGRTRFRMRFSLDEPSKVEYRAWISGKVALELDEYRRVTRIDGAQGEGEADLRDFPDDASDAPAFFNENRDLLRSYYERGIGVSLEHDDVVLNVNGVALHARCLDDLNFVGEIFDENAYNFLVDRDTCVIDVGMNIGLASLSFASKPRVVEVHAFEPFSTTYERALENFQLNPEIAAKITAHRIGLSDKDWSGELMVEDHADSGAASVVTTSGTDAVFIDLRDAGAVLRPILEAARARKLRVVLKIDCEGSEFAIFDSLGKVGAFALVDGIMVEWHALFDDRSQHSLIAHLHRQGFIVFDRSPRTGNGFFYAARLAD